MTSNVVAIEDRLEIQDLLFRYAHYVDNGLGEAWASCFLPEGRLEYFGSVIEGRSELAAFASQDLGFFPTHFVGNTLMVQTAPGRVHARSMVIVAVRGKEPAPTEVFTVPVDSPTQVLGVGVYDDEIVKTEAGWRFEVRRAGSTGIAPVHPDFLPAELRGSAGAQPDLSQGDRALVCFTGLKFACIWVERRRELQIRKAH